MKKIILFSIFLLLFTPRIAQAQTTGSWGDQGNGTFKNPLLYADYSDPDVIGVGSDYYMTASDFFYMPGYPILHSKDMVNWEIISHVYPRLDIGNEYQDPNFPWAYGRGGWAPSIRFHNNKFWVYFCTPDEGLYMSSADDPSGPWSALTEVKRISGWEDPAPFWDDDGTGYLVHASVGNGFLTLHKLSADGKTLLDDGTIIVAENITTRQYLEGPKLYKRNGYYYIFAPAGGVASGVQWAFRAHNIYGPYEEKIVLEEGTTSVNGPHQGAWVQTPGGEDWFYHFQQVGAVGRIVHLEPMSWANDWPVIGHDNNGNGIGEPVSSVIKPNVGGVFPITAPQSSDEFTSPTLGLEWQWNHDPHDDLWSLTERPGYLRLKAHNVQVSRLWYVWNMLTQKIMGPTNSAVVELDTSSMTAGQVAGLGMFSGPEAYVGVSKSASNKQFVMYYNNDWHSGTATTNGATFLQNVIWLKATVANNFTTFYTSTDGSTFTQLGTPFQMYFDNWKGMKYTLFTFNNSNTGVADFNWFHYTYDGPQRLTTGTNPSPSMYPSSSPSPSASPQPTIKQLLLAWLSGQFDKNGDGKVNSFDFAILRGN
jgi:beta-xylosidase